MNSQNSSLLALLCWASVAPVVGVAAAPPLRLADPFAARTDTLGDLLPRGAVARFGTRRLCGPMRDDPRNGVQFTPDGKWLVTGQWVHRGEDHSRAVQVWEVSTGRLVASFGMQEEGVSALALSKDGKILATGGPDGTIDIWDLPARKRLRRLVERTAGRPLLTFTPDGRSLVCNAPGKREGKTDIQIWDTRTGKKQIEYPSPFFGEHSLAVSPDGKTLAVSEYAQLDDTAVALLDLATGKQLFKVPTDQTATVVFSPTEPTFATVGCEGLVRIHDVKSGKTLRQWSAWRKVFASHRHRPIAFSPDGKTLATGGTGEAVTLWNPRDGKAIRQLPTSYYYLEYLAFSPDGKILAGWEGHKVALLDTATGKPHLRLPGHTALVTSVAAFAGGDLFASGGADGRVFIWDRRKPFPIETYRTTAKGADALSTHGTDLFAFVASRERTLEVYRRTSPKRLALFSPDAFLGTPCLSPDGKLLACRADGATVRLYSLNGDESVRRFPIPRGDQTFLTVQDIAFSLDGKHLAAACYDGVLRVGDVAKTRWVRELDGGERLTPGGFMASLKAVAYDPTGLLLAARGEGKLIFWEAARGKLVRRIEQPDDPRPERSAAKFSPDGRYLVCCEGGDAATLWEARSGQVVGRFRGHENKVVGVCFLDGGRQVLTASFDHTLLLWDRAIMRPGPAEGGLDAMWKALQGTAEDAHASVWQMVRTAGAEAFLAKRLPPIPRSDETVPTERVERWIADLSAKTPAARDAAQKGLLANMDFAEGAILRAAKTAGLSETTPTLDPLMKRVFDRRHSAERLRADRALAVLEYLGTGEAKKVLKRIADGAPGHWLTQDAAAALSRVEKK